MVATQAIQEGETVVVNGGKVLSEAEFQAYIANLSRYNCDTKHKMAGAAKIWFFWKFLSPI